jgi:hypothetical protein
VQACSLQAPRELAPLHGSLLPEHYIALLECALQVALDKHFLIPPQQLALFKRRVRFAGSLDHALHLLLMDVSSGLARHGSAFAVEQGSHWCSESC